MTPGPPATQAAQKDKSRPTSQKHVTIRRQGSCTATWLLGNSLLILSQTRLAYSRAWHLIDVGSDPRPLGRIASQIAITLMGKHKPIWEPSTDCGDYVVAIGCHDMHTTGKKRFNKKYYSHTTRPGSLKEITMDNMFAKWGGSEVLRRAVRGMLPKNRLRDDRMARLKRMSSKSCGAFHLENMANHRYRSL